LAVFGAPDGALASRTFHNLFTILGHFWGQSLARGNTPLHYAAGNGRVEVVKLLVEAKAWVTVKDRNGRGPRLGDVVGF